MYLLIGAVLIEGVITVMLVMDGGPLHLVAMKLVSFVKMGKGPFIMKTLAGVTLVNLASTLHVIYKIQRRSSKIGSPTAADHFILRTYLFESFLEGSFLLLLLVISRLYHEFCLVDLLKLKLEALQKQAQAVQNKYLRLQAEKRAPVERERAKAQEEIGSLKDLVADLRKKMENLQLESLQKDKVVKTAEANAIALQKQSEGFLLEYDRLLDDNEILRSQLVSIDRKLSYSDTKKSL